MFGGTPIGGGDRTRGPRPGVDRGNSSVRPSGLRGLKPPARTLPRGWGGLLATREAQLSWGGGEQKWLKDVGMGDGGDGD